MIIAIDPDVIVAMESDNSCVWTLHDLFLKAIEYNIQFATDKGNIEFEYLQLYLHWLEIDPEHWIITLIQQILNDEFLRYEVSSELEEFYAATIPLLSDMEAVEPQLLGIAANICKKNKKDASILQLLLCGPLVRHPKMRRRQLFQSAVESQLKITWPLLKIKFAGETTINSSLFDNYQHPKAKEFEKEVALTFPYIRSHIKVMRSPLPEKVNGKNIGDMDMFGYEEYEDRLIVVMGECKLREEGKEEKKPVACGELRKHFDRIEALKMNEILIQKAAGRSIIIDGVFISNAIGFEYGADELAKEYGIRVYQVELTKNWEREEQWKIKNFILVL
jgi:hypothetical protein